MAELQHTEQQSRALRGGTLAIVVTGLVILLLIPFAGCSTSRPAGGAGKPLLPPVPQAGQVVTGQQGKDDKVLGAAQGIEEANAAAPDSPQKPVIERQAAAIKQAVNAAPAADVARLAAEYDAGIKARDVALKEARKESDQKDAVIAARDQTIADLKNETMKRTAWTIVLVSLGIIGLSAVYIVFSPDKLGAVMTAGPGVVIGVLGLGLAQIVSHPQFKLWCGVVLLVGTAAGVWWMIRQHKKGQLERALREEAALAKDTIGKLVPVIDETISHARGAAVNEGGKLIEGLLAKLSSRMNNQEKAFIHNVRSANQDA